MKVLAVVAHPNLAKSKVNKVWANALEADGVTVRRLYDLYPDWQIDVAAEQAALLEHDRIVLQFPFYWYSSPPMMKKWLDDVLTHGWAYGSNGTKLHGKELMVVTSTGGPGFSYRSGGYNSFTLDELLRPFQQTANLTGMKWKPYFTTNHTFMLDGQAIQQSSERLTSHVLEGVKPQLAAAS